MRPLIAIAVLVSSAAFAGSPLTILWPRIIPRSEVDKSDALATALQTRLVELARKTFPGRELDVRPKGERSCPEAGCKGGSLGILLLKSGSGEGCALVALIGQPGRGAIHLTAWAGAGALELKKADVDFRDPPESQVTIKDYARCTELPAATATAPADVERSLRDSAK